MHLHLRTRFLLIMAQAKLGAALAEVGIPEALQPLTAGVGTAETEVAEDLWRLSRRELTREAFLARHGYHGPNEGVLSSRSWREDPRPVELIAASLAGQDDGSSPQARRARTLVERDELQARFVGLASRARRARRLLRLARDATAWTEQGKLLTLLALDVGRAAARAYGDELVDEGTLQEAGDLYYLTIHEVRAGLPANVRELVAFRRAKRDEYLRYDVPLTWEDTPEPIVVADQALPDASAGPLAGAGCSRGVYEGRARLVADPATDPIEPGEVLVCSTTDPSWMGIFVAAGAVVADIGGPTSHGAIVAREFGLPCVMGTVHATRAITTGDLVRVDGTAGTVEIVHRA
jgi:phosphohistidine swiveling domain-containing protein